MVLHLELYSVHDVAAVNTAFWHVKTAVFEGMKHTLSSSYGDVMSHITYTELILYKTQEYKDWRLAVININFLENNKIVYHSRFWL